MWIEIAMLEMMYPNSVTNFSRGARSQFELGSRICDRFLHINSILNLKEKKSVSMKNLFAKILEFYEKNV